MRLMIKIRVAGNAAIISLHVHSFVFETYQYLSEIQLLGLL